MKTKFLSLTEAQQAAVDYLLTRRRLGIRERAKANSIVESFCKGHGYDVLQTAQAVRDMRDVWELEVNAE